MPHKPPYDEAMPVSPGQDQQRGPLLGFMTTRVLTTEREPLFASDKGHSPGALIDARIEAMQDEWQRYPPGEARPELHSITFEFPREA